MGLHASKGTEPITSNDSLNDHLSYHPLVALKFKEMSTVLVLLRVGGMMYDKLLSD